MSKNFLKIVFLGILIISGFFVFAVGVLRAKEVDGSEIIITEVMYDPKGSNTKKSDWLEIYNPNKKDLFIDGENKKHKIIEEYFDENKLETKIIKHRINGNIVVGAGEYIVIADDINLFKNNHNDFNGKILDSSFNLAGDSKKRTNKNFKVAEVNGNKIKKIISNVIKIDKKIGGYNNDHTLALDDDGIWRESEKIGGTPGEKNFQEQEEDEQEQDEDNQNDDDQEDNMQNQDNENQAEISYSDKVYINEILPNPKGDEKKNEFIELYNNSNKDINLEDWTLKDGSKTGKFIFLKNAIIKAKNFLTIYRQSFKFALNNSGNEKVYLLNPNGEIVNQLGYEKATESVSYNLDKGNWRWSKYLTPNEKNKFDKIPKIEIKTDKKVYKNIYANFEIKIRGADKSNLKITWDFGDGHKSYKKETRHKYVETGKYSGSVKIFTGSENIVKNFKIKVVKFSKPKVKIIALMPNPKGKDSEGEWIEIKNKSKKKINLQGWSIATGTKSNKLINHPINTEIIVKAGKSVKITREDSLFSLGNKKSKIELRYPTGKVAYNVKYKKEKGIKDDEIYQKKKGEKWMWVELYKTQNEIIVLHNEKVQAKIKENNFETENEKQKIITENFIGKQSLVKQEKLKKASKLLVLEIKNKQAEDYSVAMQEGEKFVLGVETSKKVRLENGHYYFTKVTTPKKHYAKKFLDDTVIRLNSKLNMLK